MRLAWTIIYLLHVAGVSKRFEVIISYSRGSWLIKISSSPSLPVKLRRTLVSSAVWCIIGWELSLTVDTFDGLELSICCGGCCCFGAVNDVVVVIDLPKVNCSIANINEYNNMKFMISHCDEKKIKWKKLRYCTILIFHTWAKMLYLQWNS